MLTIDKFKARLIRHNHPDWLLVGVDTKDDSRLYILGNGGMGNINCAPIESFPEEIKNYAIEMVTQGELYLKGNEKPLRIGQGNSIYSYTLKQIENLLPTSSTTRKMYFSSIFIRWQRSHQLSDEHVQEKLGLTAKEFHQFREDELTITPDLINKLVEITGVSEQFWINRGDQKNKGFKGE